MNNNKSSTLIKASIVTFLLIFTTTSTLIQATTPITNTEEAASYVINKLQYNKNELLIYANGPLPQGTEILATKEHILQTPEKGYIIYIDLYPTANLFHPVQYIFISESKETLILKDAQSPPKNFDEYQLIHTEISNKIFSVQNRRAHIPENTPQKSIASTLDNRWAVLMNGGHSAGSNHIRYWNDLSNIYITLNYVYGFPDENIIVLCSDGLDPSPDQSNGQNSDPDLDGDGDDDIMYSCILSNVDLVFADLATILSSNDKLFVFTTDHGSSNGGWDVVQNLWNYEELTDAHFAALLDALPDCEKICTFEPCYSGGFLDNVVVPPGPIVASSACRHDEYSWAMSNLEYDEYVFHWTAAIKGEDAYGNPVDADFNQDGYITMDEAYIYAEANDVQPESPQYGDYPEDIGALISLFPSSEPPETPITPTGIAQGVINNEYTFTTTTTDPEGDQIYYMWDWGDGTNTTWLGPYDSGADASASHIWTEAETYQLKVKAMDDYGQESDWSYPKTVYIVEKPIIELGNISGGMFKINAVIKNVGPVDAIKVNWSMTLTGGLILTGKQRSGIIPIITAFSEHTVTSDPILGLGNTVITVTIDSEIKEQNAFVFFFYISIK